MSAPRVLFALLLGLTACGGAPEAPAEPAPAEVPAAQAPAPEAPSADVAKLARVARALAGASDDRAAEATLQAEGFTVESYEAALYEVAADPAKAAAFEAQRK